MDSAAAARLHVRKNDSSHMRSIAIHAFAKINLSLRVGPKGLDGFHQLQTIFQTIDLCDRIKCESRRGPFEILCDVPEVPVDRTNLIWRAAQVLWRASDC